MQGSRTGTLYIGRPSWHLIHVNRSYSFIREIVWTILNTLPTIDASWQKRLHRQSESHDIVTTSHREQTLIWILNNQWEGAWWGRLSWNHHSGLFEVGTITVDFSKLEPSQSTFQDEWFLLIPCLWNWESNRRRQTSVISLFSNQDTKNYILKICHMCHLNMRSVILEHIGR